MGFPETILTRYSKLRPWQARVVVRKPRATSPWPLEGTERLTSDRHPDVRKHVAECGCTLASRFGAMSFGETVSACATAVDRRVEALVMVCPILSFVRPENRDKVSAQLFKDRRLQLRGNEPFTLPRFNSKGEKPVARWRAQEGLEELKRTVL